MKKSIPFLLIAALLIGFTACGPKLTREEVIEICNSVYDKREAARTLNEPTEADFAKPEVAPEDNMRDGHEFVNLGLPSTLLWASCNVGAANPMEPGLYFAWGETEPKFEYTSENYKFGTYRALTKYNSTDGKTLLDPEDDAAAANWGGSWRMPTAAEMEELVKYCDWQWSSVKNGCYVRSRINGNFIFLPAVGARFGDSTRGNDLGGSYWSASITEDKWMFGHYGYFYQLNHSTGSYGLRYHGRSIRPVCNRNVPEQAAE